jgi:hypothetical protein
MTSSLHLRNVMSTIEPVIYRQLNDQGQYVAPGPSDNICYYQRPVCLKCETFRHAPYKEHPTDSVYCKSCLDEILKTGQITRFDDEHLRRRAYFDGGICVTCLEVMAEEKREAEKNFERSQASLAWWDQAKNSNMNRNNQDLRTDSASKEKEAETEVEENDPPSKRLRKR